MVLPIFILAWPYRFPDRTSLVEWRHAHAYELFLVTVITLGAFLLRYVALGDFAWVFSGDEGKFAWTSRDVLEGRLANPFSTTFDAQVSLWVFVQAGFMHVFGDDIRGARMFSSVMGTATIPLFYLLIRRQFDRFTATIGAILLATFHFHIFMSRDALNNISSPFFIVLSLLLLDRLLESWRPLPALVLGLVIGLGQYAYLSNRLLIPIVLTVLLLSLVLHRPREYVHWIAAIQSLFLISFGFLLAIAPLAAYYVLHPENLNARFDAVSVFSSGWLDNEVAITGRSVIEVLWLQFQHAALLPFTTYPAGYYIIDPPFIGWPLVIPGAIGLAILTANALRFQYLPWATTYWAVVVGVSLTIGSPELNRYAMGALLLPTIAAIGVVTIARLFRRLVGLPQIFIWFGLTAWLLLCTFWNVRVAFNQDPHVNVPPSRNTIAVNNFSRDLYALGPGYTVYFAGAPSLYVGGLPNLQFLAKGDTNIDVLESWSPHDPKPEITQPTIFWFIPERAGEMDVIRSWFPDGVETIHTDVSGEELYTTYFVAPEDI
jgi:4-amino-4-deoxy-L-arabinose transferase-like glycosyltransferase